MNAPISRIHWGVSLAALLILGAIGLPMLLKPIMETSDKASPDQTLRDPLNGVPPKTLKAVNANADQQKSLSLTSPSVNSGPDTPTGNRPMAVLADTKPPGAKQVSTVRLPRSLTATETSKLETEAFSIANSLIAKLPNNPKAIHVAAVCNSQLQKTGEAQKLWEKCIELQPKTETFYLNLAANALFRGDTEYALKITEQAQANGLNSGDLSHHQALALARLGEDERAVEVVRQAISTKKDSPGHWMLLGQSLLRLGKLDEAKENLEHAAALGVENRALYVALMNASVRLKQPEEAARYREKVDAMGDDATTDGNQRFAVISDREARRVLIAVLAEASSVYKEAGLYQDAELLGLRLLTIEPNNYGICRFLADLYRDTKQKANEIAVRERILELSPNDAMNVLQLARNYADNNQPEQAEATLKLAISTAPDLAIGYAATAEFLVERREAARAQWFAEQALNREPSPAGFKLLTAILQTLGKESEVQKLQLRAHELQSEAPSPNSTPVPNSTNPGQNKPQSSS